VGRDSLNQRLANLSPAKRALLELRLNQKGALTSAERTIPRTVTRGSAPLSFAQQRLWFLHQLEPHSPHYNQPKTVRLSGPLNVRALERALDEIVTRHAVLRTTFLSGDEGLVQVVAEDRHAELAIMDLQSLPEAVRETRARRLLAETIRRPFDLGRDLMLRALMLRLSAHEHILLLVTHHIASDGWSAGILWRELAGHYRAFASGDSFFLPALPIQYTDYAVWQRGWLQGEVLERQLSYWKRQLDGISALSLPTDRPRPSVPSYRGAKQALVISKDLFAGLKRLSRQEEATLFMTLLAAFQTLLYRYTGQEDVAVGSPIAGRTRPEIEGLIGFFVNTLVLRTDLSGNPSFRELLRRARDVALGAYEHQDIPFEKLVEELNPQRDRSHSPLFQVMFVLQNTPVESLKLGGLTVTPVALDGATTMFDLSLSLQEAGEELRGSLRYSTDLFNEATIKRMAEHFCRLLQAIVENPGQPIGELPLISRVERRQFVTGSRMASDADSESSPSHHPIEDREAPTHAVRPSGSEKHQLNLTDMIARWAERTPDTVAIEAPGRTSLTYGQLLSKIKIVAQQLRSLGVAPDDRVALALPDGPESALALLGIASVATCAPLNPNCTRDEFEFYLKDLNAKALMVLAKEASPARAVAQARGILTLEIVPKLDGAAGFFTLEGEQKSSTGREHTPGPQDVALVLYTSGTTSRPKLVPLSHANLLASTGNIGAAVALSRNDRCLNIMPLYHVHGLVGALLSSLAAGASVVCTPGFFAPEFLGWLEQFRPTWYTAVPTVHRAILARAEANRNKISRCPLRFIRSSSAALEPRLMEQLENVFQVPVIESFGMTEAAHQISSNPLPPRTRKTGSAGVAAGPEVAIVDPEGNLLQAGISGEVVIRGTSVFLGYEKDPSANAAAFTKGWFRTGDQGYLDADGYLFLTGRFKEIINRGGEKISPREVEEVLLGHLAVTEAVAFPVPHASLGEEVAAAVVLRRPGAVTARQLRDFVASRLAAFKVPRQVVFVSEIPKGATGKVQRTGLAGQLGIAAADQVTTKESAVFQPPQTNTEKLLADIWGEVLGLNQIGRSDNFFQLGGDSLLAAQIINRVHARLCVEVSLIGFFDKPTVAEMAEAIEQEKHTDQLPRSLAPRAVLRTAVLPLSFAQQSLWFLHQMHPDTWVHNRPLAVRLTGRLNTDAMEESLNVIVNRHEALRTTFPMLQDSPVQVIHSTQPLKLRSVDLSMVPLPDREAQAKEILGEEARRPFDLAQGPVLRAAVVKVGKEDHLVIVTSHHIASDGWSDKVFLSELATAYNAITAGVPPDLPSLGIQYADFAAWEREKLQGERLEKLLTYWKGQMGSGFPRLKIPLGASPRTATDPRRGAHQVLDLSVRLSEELNVLSKQEEVTLFMTLLAGFKTLLYRYTGQEDLMVATPTAGRRSEALEGVIGNFTNILGLRTDLSGNPSFRALLAHVRQVTLQGYLHQDLPLGRLAQALRAESGLSPIFPFQVMFNFRNFPSSALHFAGLHVSDFDFDHGIARFDLSVDIVEKSDRIRCLFEYDTAVFDSATIDRLICHYQTLLEGIVENPDTPLDSLPLLRSGEPLTVGENLAVTGDDNRGQGGIHNRFEEQVARTPTATAVSYDGQGLSYGELNARANQVAHYLRGLGVKPGTLVGISVERSLDMAAGLLGILKAGAAYVPLDPKYPMERLAFLLDDTKVTVVLAQQRLLSALPLRGRHCVSLDAEWPVIARENEENPASGNITPDHLAYVMYTSGSSGKPKGVLIRHGGVVHHSVAMAQHFALDPLDRMAQCGSISFDISVEEIFPSWISGASLILCPPAVFTPGPDLIRWIDDERITVLLLPTAFWHEWVYYLERSQDAVPRCLRLVAIGGEKASADVLVKWKRIVGTQVRWVNTYGPTEATVTTTLYEPAPGSMTGAELTEVPIGGPIANSRIYILDRRLDPVPIGVVGELCIGGAGLAAGYLDRPELTAERFVPNPLSNERGDRLYRTGDLARFLPDGNAEFMGRIDSQVKLHGFRIELGEIEAVLNQHPSVQNSVVVVREDEISAKRLIAYIVGNKEMSSENLELRSFLQQKLPEYMVPSGFEFIEAFPLTANGKINRQALPAPKGIRPGGKATFVSPRNKPEAKLAEIWAKLLGVKQIGVYDNFFALGGHSLLAVRLFAEIEKEFKTRLPIASLFEQGTVAHLASLINRGSAPTSRSSLVAIQPLGVTRPFFCVHEFFGDVLCYVNLSRHMGAAQRFYALQPVGLDGDEEPFADFEAMAAHYIEEIRTVQPHGPYALGGLCSGGVVAFEMAQQLQARGEVVDVLALLDSWAPKSRQGRAGWDWSFVRDFVRDLPSWLMGSWQLNRFQWLNLIKLKIRRARVRWAATSAENYAPRLITEMADFFQFSERHRKVARAQSQALRQYRPRIYSGRITLFRARMQPLFSPHDSDKGWRPLAAGGLTIKVVPGNHLGMLQEPHVQVLAEQLRVCLRSVETDPNSEKRF